MTNIEHLKKACLALYTMVPEDVADSVAAVADAVITDSERDRLYIECLENGGVDNWSWYSESLAPYWEKYN